MPAMHAHSCLPDMNAQAVPCPAPLPLEGRLQVLAAVPQVERELGHAGPEQQETQEVVSWQPGLATPKLSIGWKSRRTAKTAPSGARFPPLRPAPRLEGLPSCMQHTPAEFALDSLVQQILPRAGHAPADLLQLGRRVPLVRSAD